MTEAASAAPESSTTPQPGASAPSAAPAEDSATPATGAPAAQDSQPAPDGQDKPTAPDKAYSKDDIRRIVARETAKERRRMERELDLRVENEMLRRQAGNPQTRGDSPTAPGNGEKPRPELFKDWDSYQEALTDWKVDQKLKGLSEHQVKQREQEQAAVQFQEYRETVLGKLADGMEKFEDFEEVIGAPGVAFTAPMVDALIRTKAPAEVAYYLGQNPKESQRIARLPLAEQVFAIRDLADTLAKPPAPTKAPEPIKPTLGTASGVEPSLDDVAGNYKEWKRLRERQLAQRQ